MLNIIKAIIEWIISFFRGLFHVLLGIAKEECQETEERDPVVIESEPIYESLFFETQKEEDSFMVAVSRFIKTHKPRPELVYYMFCVNEKLTGFKIDGEQTSFVRKSGLDFHTLLKGFPKLYSFIFNISGTLNLDHNKMFCSFLSKEMFEASSSINVARYNPSFLAMVRT